MPHPLPILDRHSPRPLFGLSISYPAPGIIERIGASWDWFWIDAQHGELAYQDVVDLVRAADFMGKPAVVRVPGLDPSYAARILDIGAAGIIVPMIESLAEARIMIQATKFPPIGNRSFGGLRVATRNTAQYHRTANRDTVLIAQLESNNAVALAEKLAALDGIDGLFIGPGDLMMRNGGDPVGSPDMAAIGRQTEIVANACQRHGKLNVALAGNDVGIEMAKRFQHQLVVGSGDLFLLQAGSDARIQKMRDAFGVKSPGAAAPAKKAKKKRS